MISAFLLLAPLAAPAQCQPAVYDLIAAQHFDIGDVTITNTGDTLRIDVALDPRGVHRWHGTIHALHIYAGVGLPPGAANCGNPAPGHFPYKTDFPHGTHHHTELIPFADLGVVCGDQIQIAVHADVSCALHNDETAWSTGQNSFCGDRWGWWVDYDTCCTTSGSGMNLSVGPLAAGSTAALQVDGAQAGELLSFYRSSGPIVMGSGYAHPAFGTTVLDIQAPLTRLGAVLADAVGSATLLVTIPPRVPSGTLLAVQAVALRQPDAAASNAVYLRLN